MLEEVVAHRTKIRKIIGNNVVCRLFGMPYKDGLQANPSIYVIGLWSLIEVMLLNVLSK